jgi:hypothetical protein
MIDMSGDILPIYRRIVRGLCTGNTLLLEQAVKEMKRVGWVDHEFMSDVILSKIVNRRVQVLHEENVRKDLITLGNISHLFSSFSLIFSFLIMVIYSIYKLFFSPFHQAKQPGTSRENHLHPKALPKDEPRS